MSADSAQWRNCFAVSMHLKFVCGRFLPTVFQTKYRRLLGKNEFRALCSLMDRYSYDTTVEVFLTRTQSNIITSLTEDVFSAAELKEISNCAGISNYPSGI